jgi:hypothetical protein
MQGTSSSPLSGLIRSRLALVSLIDDESIEMTRTTRQASNRMVINRKVNTASLGNQIFRITETSEDAGALQSYPEYQREYCKVNTQGLNL